MKREYPDRPLVGIGAVIIQDGRVVVVKRATEPLKGRWSVPGGMLELGEKLREGTAREALEETGLIIEAGDVLDVFDAIYVDPKGLTQYHYVLIDFLCRPVGGELRASSDVSEVRWASEATLDALGMTENTLKVIRKGFDSFNRHSPNH
jgi:8-oxo-dGTP diphosphatase